MVQENHLSREGRKTLKNEAILIIAGIFLVAGTTLALIRFERNINGEFADIAAQFDTVAVAEPSNPEADKAVKNDDKSNANANKSASNPNSSNSYYVASSRPAGDSSARPMTSSNESSQQPASNPKQPSSIEGVVNTILCLPVVCQ